MTSARAPLLGAALTTLILAGTALHVPGSETVGSETLCYTFEAVLAVAAIVYGLAVRHILRHGAPLALVLGFAVLLRLPVLIAPPFLSTDLYRYVWDGHVQNAGINPYLHIPDDPALTDLRLPDISPHIGRREYARTIYPPAAQVLFAAVARISPTALAMKLAMALAEAVTWTVVIVLLRQAALPASRVLILAWHPVAVWDFSGNGHVDAAAMAAIALAMLLHAAHRRTATGVLLAVATLIKFPPLALAPALWRPRRWPHLDWRVPAAALVTVVALYACYLGAGWGVLGFLPGYGDEEGFRSGLGFWPLAVVHLLVPLPPNAGHFYLAACAALLAALALRVAYARDDPTHPIVQLAKNGAILATAATFAISPHYPWYYVWLALPVCLSPHASVIWLSVAPLLLYCYPIAGFAVWPSLIFIPFLALATRDIRRGLTA